MNGIQLVEALRTQDRNSLARVDVVPDDFSAPFARIINDLGTPQLMTAVRICREAKSGRAAGEALLALTAHPNVQVAVPAAMAMERVAEPPTAAALVSSIPVRQDVMVRESLYIALSRVVTRADLPAARSLFKLEWSPRAKCKAEVVVVKAGGDVERKPFFKRIQAVRGDTAEDLHKELLAVGDVAFAPALLPWFDNEASAFARGDHAKPVHVRVCDLATHAAAKLGVVFPAAADVVAIDRYDEQWVDEALAAVAKIPLAPEFK